MAFPTIPTTGAGRILSVNDTAGGGTKTFPNLSSLTKSSGDLLIAICVIYDGNSTNAEFSSWGGGFTEFADQAGTATMGIGCAYKWSTGSESGTFTVTTADTSTNDSVMILLSIPGAHASTPPEAGLMTTGTSVAANVAVLNPAGWGTEDTLWISVGGCGETGTTGSFTGVTASPTGFGSDFVTTITADVVGGVNACIGFQQLNAASLDPGSHTVDTSNTRNAGLLLAVRPAPAANQGSVTGTIDWAGTATGTRMSSGAASGSIAWVGSSSGVRSPQGAGSGSVVWAGTADGEAPVVIMDGSASGTITWSGNAQGSKVTSGAATGTIGWAGNATGDIDTEGAGSGTVIWAGTVTGATVHQGAAAGTITWAGSATGEAPGVGVQEGSADGTITWSGTATGVHVSSGAGSGAIGWGGSATGTTTRAGVSTGNITWTGVASGQSVDRFYAVAGGARVVGASSGGVLTGSLSAGGSVGRIEVR